MLGHFLLKDPEIYDTLVDMIDTHRAKVAENNDSYGLGEIGARLLRPDDQVIGETAEVYEAEYTDATDEYLLAAASGNRVPTGMGVLVLGWHCPADLGGDGILEVDLENIKRQEVRARDAYNSELNHIYVEPQQVVFAKDNDLIEFIIRNEAGVDITTDIWPFSFLIGPRKQLLI